MPILLGREKRRGREGKLCIAAQAALGQGGSEDPAPSTQTPSCLPDPRASPLSLVSDCTRLGAEAMTIQTIEWIVWPCWRRNEKSRFGRTGLLSICSRAYWQLLGPRASLAGSEVIVSARETIPCAFMSSLLCVRLAVLNSPAFIRTGIRAHPNDLILG